MSNVLIEEQHLKDIADAIRGKNGSNQAYYPSEMAQAIIDIPGGGTPTQYNVLCFTAEEPNSTVYIQCNTSLGIHLQYSYDNQNWNDWSSSVSADGQDVFSTISLTNAGDKVYVRGNNATMGTSLSIYSRFYMSGKISASGNIQSLLYFDCSCLSVRDYCYYSIFQDCTSLTTAPELPATTLSYGCYYTMFKGCTNLSEAPELPATTLSERCYYGMFSDCTSLTHAPELPATTLCGRCYSYMLVRCTSLTEAPALLATTLVSECYVGMFYGCTLLNSVKVGATSWNPSYATDWLAEVSATGTFTKPSATGIPGGPNGIPSGWEVINV